MLAQALAQEPANEDGLALLSRVLVAGRRFAEAEAVDERLLRAPDSEFAVAVRCLAVLLEAHGLITPGPRGA